MAATIEIGGIRAQLRDDGLWYCDDFELLGLIVTAASGLTLGPNNGDPIIAEAQIVADVLGGNLIRATPSYRFDPEVIY